VPRGTMIGGSISIPAPPENSGASDPGRTTQEGISEPPRGAMGRTMLGIPQSPLPPVPDPSAQAARVPAKFPARTMLGMPNMGMPAGPVPAAAPSPPPNAGAPPDAAPPGPRNAPTLVGGSVTGPEREPEEAAPAFGSTGASITRRSLDANTMMGLSDDAPPAEEARLVPRATGEIVRETPRRGSRPSSGRHTAASRPAGVRRGPSLLLFGLAALAFAAAVALGYLATRERGPEVRVRVATEGGNETMVFEVPGAAAGTKLRFGGQETPLAAGRASFPLAPDSLRVGSNVVLYDLIEPKGKIHSGKIALALDYRVTLDTAPLRSGKSAVDVVVGAVPGSKVWLDGQPLALDAQGRAVRADPLDLGGASGRIEHVVNYRVQPPSGENSVGELRTTIPVTMVEIDKPGPEVITERDAVEIAGAVDKNAQVTIDGQPVQVLGGRFLHSYPLPEPGEYKPVVMASSEGKAPHSISLHVKRVPDLAEAAKGFEFDKTLTYAKIAQNPAIYRGQRVAMEGRVYNVNVEGGRSALQLLVRECPDGQRCPLWVSYHAATEFTVDSWVRVLGVAQGEQQFRSETDEVKVVPKVDATFLLPAKP